MAKSIFEQLGGTYERQGDYLIPRLTLPAEKEKSVGIYGQRHLRYLKEYHRVTHTNLLTSGRLNSYLADIDEQAQERLETLTQQMKQAQGITERLKADNQMEWVQRMNNIRATRRSLRLKFLCPKSFMRKAPNGRYTYVCLCQTPCTDSKYGKCVYVYPNKNLRLYSGISRDDPRFEAIYKQRTAVERSINTLKDTLGVQGRKTSNTLTTKADLFPALSTCFASCSHTSSTIQSLPADPVISLPDLF